MREWFGSTQVLKIVTECPPSAKSAAAPAHSSSLPPHGAEQELKKTKRDNTTPLKTAKTFSPVETAGFYKMIVYSGSKAIAEELKQVVFRYLRQVSSPTIQPKAIAHEMIA